MRLSSRLLPCLALPSALVGLAGAGCQSSAAATTYTPYQGINIDSTALVAPYGCGTGPGQVYRYVATVQELPDGGPAPDGHASSDAGAPILAAGVFDCFADGVFEGLPVAPATFVVTIYAFTYAESAAAGFACDGSPCVPPAIDAGAPPSGYSWTTTCLGSVETAASSIAQCGPLLPPGNMDAGADADAGAGADAGLAPFEAGLDAR